MKNKSYFVFLWESCLKVLIFTWVYYYYKTIEKNIWFIEFENKSFYLILLIKY